MSDLTALLGGIGGVTGIVGGITGAINTQRQATRNRRRQRAAISEAREFTTGRLEELLGPDSLFAQGTEFLRSTFGEAAESSLAQDFVKQIRAAQAARGTFSGAGAAAAEAGGLAAFSQELRTRLLPSLLQFTTTPETLRQSILGFEAPLRVASRTGAALPGMAPPPILPDVFTSALNSGIAGLTGGAQIGIGLAGVNQQQQALTNQQTQNQQLLGLLKQGQQSSFIDQFKNRSTLISQLQGSGISPQVLAFLGGM